MSTIHILHENAEWTAPLIAALEKRGLAYRDWFLAGGSVDLSEAPPDGIFYNRMSASSHTRGHTYAPELTAAVLKWLEQWGRPVLNGSHALALEVSKVAQYAALENAGIPYPRTVACVGRDAIVAAWDRFTGPVITKHNRAGMGLGVRLFRDKAALKDYVMGDAFEDSRDGVTLVQEYVRAPEPSIVRCEFIGREFFYAVRVDTSEGFELCPADACEVADPTCVFEAGKEPAQANKFEILKDFRPPYLTRMQRVMADNDIHVAGFEFIRDAAGDAYVYDINTNTNYNSAAEQRAGVSAIDRLAEYLGAMASDTALPPSDRRQAAVVSR
jgi:hypothetical protein